MFKFSSFLYLQIIYKNELMDWIIHNISLTRNLDCEEYKSKYYDNDVSWSKQFLIYDLDTSIWPPILFLLAKNKIMWNLAIWWGVVCKSL